MNKSIQAIRSNMNGVTYYSAAISFEFINKYVSSKGYPTSTYNSNKVRDSILVGEYSRFLNNIILSVHPPYPNWIGCKLTDEDEEFFDIGLLKFTDYSVIELVDAVDVVNGIKSALEITDVFNNLMIPVIFVGETTTNNSLIEMDSNPIEIPDNVTDQID